MEFVILGKELKFWSQVKAKLEVFLSTGTEALTHLENTSVKSISQRAEAEENTSEVKELVNQTWGSDDAFVALKRYMANCTQIGGDFSNHTTAAACLNVFGNWVTKHGEVKVDDAVAELADIVFKAMPAEWVTTGAKQCCICFELVRFRLINTTFL